MLPHLNPDTNSNLFTEQLPDSRLAIYIHVPFCRTRCTYCAFNTYTGQEHLVRPYAAALIREITAVRPHVHPVASIYFGGGTPSLLPLDALDSIIDACACAFELTPDCEITLEANPGTGDISYLSQLRAIGITRISIGMQSAHPHELRLFARSHSLDDVRATVAMARLAGFDNINLDAIYGIPAQTHDLWKATLRELHALAPDHISLYSLSIEDATPLHQLIVQGRIAYPDADRAADMYEIASDFLAAAGYSQYEISNWAASERICRHNVHVWRNLPYWGFGAGAHSYMNNTRYVNTLLPAAYIARLTAPELTTPFPAAYETTSLTQQDVMSETMILGLRLLIDGIAYREFSARFGYDLDTVFGQQCDYLIAAGLLECIIDRQGDRRLRLTARGRLLGNRVFAEFI